MCTKYVSSGHVMEKINRSPNKTQIWRRIRDGITRVACKRWCCSIGKEQGQAPSMPNSDKISRAFFRGQRNMLPDEWANTIPKKYLSAPRYLIRKKEEECIFLDILMSTRCLQRNVYIYIYKENHDSCGNIPSKHWIGQYLNISRTYWLTTILTIS